MPGLARRREQDTRGPRLESEVTASVLRRMKPHPTRTVERQLYACSRCNTLYEERSRHCPRCDAKTMNEVRHIPEDQRARYRDNELRRLREKWSRP